MSNGDTVRPIVMSALVVGLIALGQLSREW